MKHGQGVYFYKDGKREEGQYSYGEPHGQLIMITNNGKRIKQEWDNGTLISENQLS